MSSLTRFANNNLNQIFLALLPNKTNNQNIGKKEKLSEIQDILKFGVDVNTEIHPGFSPLCKVIEEGGSKALVETLLYYGAKVENSHDDFMWTDTDGTVITNQAYALARQRYLKEKTKESLDIQQLIQKQLIQKHLSISLSAALSQENEEHQLTNFGSTERDPEFRLKNLNGLNGLSDLSDLSGLTCLNQSTNISKVTNVLASTYPEDRSIKKRLYIFSFDEVLVNGHFDNILKEMGVAPGKASNDLVEFLFSKYGIKHKEILIQVFQNIFKNNDYISIASTTRYPETVFAMLVALGLSDDEIDQIYYNRPDLTLEPDLTVGKNLDILKAMIHFDIIDINSVYLIDHDRTNLQIAKSKLNLPDTNLLKVESGQDASQQHLQQILNLYLKRKVIEDSKVNVNPMGNTIIATKEKSTSYTPYNYEQKPNTISTALAG